MTATDRLNRTVEMFGDAPKDVRLLADERCIDYLLIDSSGVSEPLPVATTFDFRDEDGESLSDVTRLNA